MIRQSKRLEHKALVQALSVYISPFDHLKFPKLPKVDGAPTISTRFIKTFTFTSNPAGQLLFRVHVTGQVV